MKERYLIVGLGNPGKAYEETRHNVGFRVVQLLAEKRGLSLKPRLDIAKGNLAEGEMLGKDVLLLQPLTYMNSSGYAVRLCCDYFKVPFEHALVIVDDVALPFGHLRFRTGGSAGGHNGLKSVEEYLGTQDYPRLRIGVGHDPQSELASYVLGPFTKEEKGALGDIFGNAVIVVETWITLGPEAAMRLNK
ncbi:MAG TPA: aminoacyl-tRNA hydrolase [Rhabdochlamydiaceae bacterium]|nr:aminoacyl-tRNA hydrolase [Rhabdochlamydiaceae bacterium]